MLNVDRWLLETDLIGWPAGCWARPYELASLSQCLCERISLLQVIKYKLSSTFFLSLYQRKKETRKRHLIFTACKQNILESNITQKSPTESHCSLSPCLVWVEWITPSSPLAIKCNNVLSENSRPRWRCKPGLDIFQEYSTHYVITEANWLD